MKRMLGLTLILVVSYFAIQILFTFVDKKYDNKYEISDGLRNYTIEETLMLNNSVWSNNYFININIDNIDYTYEVYRDFNRITRIVEKVKYYEDNKYKCLFIKFKNNKILSEVKCYDGEFIYPYHNIKEKNENLELFIKSLETEGYNQKNYTNKNTQTSTKDSIHVYGNNINTNYYIGVYNGNNLYRINGIDKIAEEEVEQGSARIFLKDKFVVVDTSANYIQLHVNSIISNSKRDLVTHLKTQEYKYIGGYDNYLYFYNEKDKNEYQIDIDSLKIKRTKTKENDIKYFEEGVWNYKNIEDIELNKINFGSKYFVVEKNDNERVIKFAKDKGYYYYFRKNNDYFDVYRGINEEGKNLMFLFKTNDYESVSFIDENILYLKDNKLNIYSDNQGEKVLLKLDYISNNMIYTIYKKGK